MEPLYKQSSYFSTQASLKKQEQELEKLLRERLPHSDLAAPLFDLLAIRRELAKEVLTREGGDHEKGVARALKELIDLFKPK